jgi:peptidoglycan/LPS O-acetylase OafA/YrhL
MRREQIQGAPDPRQDRKRYNRQIWSGGITIFLLLAIFGWLLRTPYVRPAMPVLASAIGLIVAVLAVWVGLVSHRDTAAVRQLHGAALRHPRGASWFYQLSSVKLANWEKAVVVTALALAVVLAALFGFVPATALWQSDLFRAGLAFAVSGAAALALHLFLRLQIGNPTTLIVQGSGAVIVFVLILYITKFIVPL